MTRDPQTIETYNRQAGDYARLTKADARDEFLIAFIDAMPEGAHVLDLGCGPGFAAAEMADAGLVVVAVDASEEMIELAARHPGVSARLETFDDISGADLYDGIWANFSLLHAPRRDMPRHLAGLAKALKPGGRFHIGVKSGTGEKRDRLGRLYTYYQEAELRRLLEEAGLNVTDAKTGKGVGLDGSVADWVVLTAHG